MKLRHFSLTLITALLLVAAAGRRPAIAQEQEVQPAAAPASQSVWSVFTSPQQDFSVLMPGEPQETSASTSINTVSIDIQGFVVRRYDDTVQYLVTRIDFPADLDTQNIDPEQFLEAMQSRILAQAEGELLEAQNVSLNNYPGREIKLQATQDEQVMVAINRLYWVNRKLYQISVTVPQTLEPSLAGSSTGFLNSFRLITD